MDDLTQRRMFWCHQLHHKYHDYILCFFLLIVLFLDNRPKAKAKKFSYFDTVSHYVAQAGFKFTITLCLNVRITSVLHHVTQIFYFSFWGWNSYPEPYFVVRAPFSMALKISFYSFLVNVIIIPHSSLLSPQWLFKNINFLVCSKRKW